MRRGICILLALYGAGLLAIFYSPLADYLVASLAVSADARPAPAIVVLTAFVTDDGVLTEPAMRRTLAAARLYREGLSPLLIITGGRANGRPDRQDADFMAAFAEELGVPASAILIEKQSTDTHTSAVEVARLSRARGIAHVLLVSDAVHLRRAAAAFRAQHLPVSAIPADPWLLDWEGPQIRLRKFRAGIHEYGGMLYYRWKGWI
jgi:uncharacterized SAM-binding protein YcdF (DUF218 family)